MSLPISTGVSLINSGDDCLSNLDFYVPAYQRPYSWGEDQIDDFLKTIIDGFSDNTPRFFGTMQFDVKPNCFDVVDGQQRLTTMKLFMYVLSGLSGSKSFDFNIKYNNVKNANVTLDNLLARPISSVLATEKTKQGKTDVNNINSVFEANIRMLKEKLLKYIEDDTKNRSVSDYASDLISYFGNSVYVVILKTEKLSLPEVVNIFNTINTTGMDLNSEDTFKFQYYEYLRINEKCPESLANDDYWIEKINECYRKVEEYNEGKPIKNHISMTDVLSVYQHCICAKYEDNYKILAKSSERFFSDIFNNPSRYSDLLKYSEFERLVDEFISFYDELDKNEYRSNNWHSLSVHLIKKTRYPRYWTVPFVYSYFNGTDKKTREEALKTGFVLFSYLIVHSINYAKAINPVHTFVCRDILPAIVNKQDIVAIVKPYQWSDPYDEDTNKKAQGYFSGNLEKNAFSNSKSWLICLLLALYEEQNEPLENLKGLFFNPELNPFDIEHIYSHDTFSNDPMFNDDDKAYFNGIGNLVVLDRKINRDMGRCQVLSPQDKYNKRDKYYEKSIYKIVKDFTPRLNGWDLNGVKQRSSDQLYTLTNVILKI